MIEFQWTEKELSTRAGKQRDYGPAELKGPSHGYIILLFGITSYMLAPDLIYLMQKFWFPISGETFDLAFYSFIGLFKIIFLFFNLVPYIALLIIWISDL